jgi:hypothetical protein
MEHPTNLMTITAVFTFAELQTAHAVHPEHTTTMESA